MCFVDQSGFNLTFSDNAAEGEGYTSAGKDERPMDQSDGVGDSSAPAAQAPDSSKFWLIYI